MVGRIGCTWVVVVVVGIVAVVVVVAAVVGVALVVGVVVLVLVAEVVALAVEVVLAELALELAEPAGEIHPVVRCRHEGQGEIACLI